MAVNRDNVLVSGGTFFTNHLSIFDLSQGIGIGIGMWYVGNCAGDNGSLMFWDWKTGYNFQQLQTIGQPGSLDSEAGIFDAAFDHVIQSFLPTTISLEMNRVIAMNDNVNRLVVDYLHVKPIKLLKCGKKTTAR
jgi:hypothetical protein